MHCVTAIVLSACVALRVARTPVKELAVIHKSKLTDEVADTLVYRAQNSIDNLISGLIDNLVDNLFHATVLSLPLHHTDLDDTTLGKHRTNSRPLAHARTTPCDSTSPGIYCRPEQRLTAVRSQPDNVITTYGEITQKGLSVFLPYYRQTASNHFLDLGSGTGTSLLRFHSLFPGATSIMGIEYLQERHHAAVAKIQSAFDDAPEPICDSEYHHRAFHLYCGNFFDSQFSKVVEQASLVYVSNLCFGEELNDKLSALLRLNRQAVVVSSKRLSRLGSMPTTLDQSWNSETLGYIWRVGDNRTDDDVWAAKLVGAESPDPSAFKLWYSLGLVGGFTVHRKLFNNARCFQEALALDPNHAKSWSMLGGAGGGKVNQTFYSQAECAQRALVIDPKSSNAWYNLGSGGGGTVDGIHYNQTECAQQALATAHAFNPVSAMIAYAIAWNNLNANRSNANGIQEKETVFSQKGIALDLKHANI